MINAVGEEGFFLSFIDSVFFAVLMAFHCIGSNHNKHLIGMVTSIMFASSVHFVATESTIEKCYLQKAIGQTFKAAVKIVSVLENNAIKHSVPFKK